MFDSGCDDSLEIGCVEGPWSESIYTKSRDDCIYECLADVCAALSTKGYDAVNQLVGYLMSDDPVYITSYRDARSSISRFSREEILRFLLKRCLKHF